MTTIAIVGAGPGLGAAVARRFGAEGFNIALLARSQERVDALAAELTSSGLTAAGYTTDVRKPDALAGALQRAADDLSTIEVLQYSPVPQPEFMHTVLETTIGDLTSAVEFSIYGPVTACSRSCPACDPWATEPSVRQRRQRRSAQPKRGGHLHRLRGRRRVRVHAPHRPLHRERARRTTHHPRRHNVRPPHPRPRRASRKALDDAHHPEHLPRLRRTNGALNQCPEVGLTWAQLLTAPYSGTARRPRGLLLAPGVCVETGQSESNC